MNSIDLTYNEDLLQQRLIPCDSPERITITDDFFTSSAVLFSIIPHDNKPYELILIHRTNRGTKHRGEMSFPGGKFEEIQDNSLKDTALRETEEEIGVPRSKIKLIGCLDDFPTMTRYIVTPYVGVINKNQILVKQEREVQEIVKIPIEFFVKKVNFKEQVVDLHGSKFPIFYFNYRQTGTKKVYTVWGATAYMISNFIERVYDLEISELGMKRARVEKINDIKEYIKLRNQVTKNFDKKI